MPSLKPVKSLFDLSLCATRDLVISAAKNIEKIYPSASGLSYDVPGCSEAVLPMQDLLRDLLPVTVYESLFQAVTERVSYFPYTTGISDQRIVFSTFIYLNVKLEKLVLDYRYFTEYGSDTWQWEDDAEKITTNQRHVAFWLNQLPMLANLVELDLKSVWNDDMILAFIRTCTELQSLRLRSVEVSPATLVSVLQSIPSLTKLHKFDCHIDPPCLEELMTTLDVDKKWTIRNLWFDEVTPEELNFMINLCPHLVDLDISTTAGKQQEILQILASCPHKFYKLSLDSYEDTMEAFSNLFDCKGIHIRELRIFCGVNPLEILLLVSETCKNLSSLCIKSSLVPQNRALFHYVIAFPKLERLVVSNSSSGSTSGLIAMAKHCLANAPKLISFEIDKWPVEEDIEEEEQLIQLFTANQRTKQLKYLHITSFKELLSTNLSRKIFEWCTNLKSFKIGYLDADAKLYLSGVNEEIKHKNLDIDVEFH